MILRPLVPALLLLLASCDQSGPTDIRVGDAWARPTRGDAPGAVYLTIRNNGPDDDRLIDVDTDRAALAMVHQSELVDGVARMRVAEQIHLPAEQQIRMVPGGTHIMLEGLRAPLKPGDRFKLVLKFRHSGDRQATVSVVEADSR